LDNKSVGRKHCSITFDKGSFLFEDLGSVNGSRINGKRVKGTLMLSDGDRIKCGNMILSFVAGSSTGTGSGAAKKVEAARLRKENEALRSKLSALSDDSSQANSQANDKIAELKESLGGLEDEIRHMRGLLEDSEQRIKDAESRAATANSSLESIHSKYMDMRDQVQHSQSLLEDARVEASNAEQEAAELRERVASLSDQAEAASSRGGQAAEDISNLKVEITEKDREIERQKRELDIRDYDLKALKEENERLQEYCETDTGRQDDIERKMKNLEAVIEENRNYIEELRRKIEEKDRELREVRLGVGIDDLEEEKQRLLDDFHKKSRQVDSLRSDMAALSADLEGAGAERDDLKSKVKKLEKASRTRKADREDISDHPDYKAMARKVVRLEKKVGTQGDELKAIKKERKK